VKYAWMKEHNQQFGIIDMCGVLDVSTSGYYDWLDRTEACAQHKRENLAQAVARAYFGSERIYGYRKVHAEISGHDPVCCGETVRRIMSSLGLFSRVKRQFVVTTDSCHMLTVAENLLARDFMASAINLKWVTDITYIETDEGWLYLAAVMDLCSRRIVGWSMSARIDAKLVESAIEMAIVQRGPHAGLICHSDRGVQYASEQVRNILGSHGIRQSMSRRGNCWDNAPMESFFSSLKREWLDAKKLPDHDQARKEVFSYIEMFYNRRRLHASLGYVSPAAYEQNLQNQNELAA
jgi:putative transposase